MKSLPLLLTLLSSVAFAAPKPSDSAAKGAHGDVFLSAGNSYKTGHELPYTTIAYLNRAVDLPAGKKLIINTLTVDRKWEPLTSSIIKGVAIEPAGAAKMTIRQLTDLPEGTPHNTGLQQAEFKAIDAKSFSVLFTDNLGQRATLQVNPTK